MKRPVDPKVRASRKLPSRKAAHAVTTKPATERGRFALRLAVLLLALAGACAAALVYPLVSGDDVLGARWQYPWALLGLLVVPFLAWRATFGEDRRVPRLRLGTLAPLLVGPSGWRVWLRDVPGTLRSVALACLVVAAARPVSAVTPTSSDDEGIDLVIVLDLSGSMQAVMEGLPEEVDRDRAARTPGTPPTRLDAAKAVIRDFVSRRKTDRIGVVVFGKEAYVLSPPTLDYHLLDTLVARMELRLIDGTATAIGDAIGVAAARLRRSHARSKAVVLLTDGDNNSGAISPEYATHLVNRVGASVFTVQIGSGELAQVQAGTDLFGNPRFVTERFPVNPELLAKIAKETAGEYYVATDARALQASLHAVLDKLEKTKFEASIATYKELFRLFLLPGVLLLAIDALLRSLLLRRFP